MAHEEVEAAFKLCGGKVGRPLLAFIARMAAYRREAQATRGGSGAVPALAERAAAVAAAATSDHISALTVRMQVAFEAMFAEAHSVVDKRRRARLRKLKELGDAIVGVPAVDAADMATLVSLHKQIGAYVTAYLSADPAVAGMGAAPAATLEAAQRELAAAMESVFPRVGVRHFTHLPPPDKIPQLDELSHLVLGIRLFNWSSGKGGAGIEDTPATAAAAAREALVDIERTSLHQTELCQHYVNLLLATRGRAVTVSPAAVARWALELCHHRQLAIYASSLAGDLRAHAAALESTTAAYEREMGEVRGLIGGRATISKDVVYPHFHNAAAHWLKAAEIRDAIVAAKTAASALAPFAAMRVSTLPPETALADARRALASGAVAVSVLTPPSEVVARTAAAVEAGEVDAPSTLSLERSPEFLQLPLEYQGFCPVAAASSVAAVAAETATSSPEDVAAVQPPGGAALARTPGSSGVPDVGVIMAGDVSLGVVRWEGRHYVCSSRAALEAFLAAPGWYVQHVRELAAQHEELVHLLQVVSAAPQAAGTGEPQGYPEAFLPMILQYDGDLAATAAAVRMSVEGAGGGGVGAGAGAGAAAAAATVRLSKRGRPLVDVGVETPTHFVERHFDPTYTWNEWTLRRRALAVMNLLNCRTTSQQTDASHFRKDAASQVYLPADATTQTGISVGTNTDRVMRYLGGLRGVREPAVEAAAVALGFTGEGRTSPAHRDMSAAAGASAVVLGGEAAASVGSGTAGGRERLVVQPARDRITVRTYVGADPLAGSAGAVAAVAGVAGAPAPAPSGGVRLKVMTLSLDTAEPRDVRRGPLEA